MLTLYNTSLYLTRVDIMYGNTDTICPIVIPSQKQYTLLYLT